MKNPQKFFAILAAVAIAFVAIGATIESERIGAGILTAGILYMIYGIVGLAVQSVDW